MAPPSARRSPGRVGVKFFHLQANILRHGFNPLAQPDMGRVIDASFMPDHVDGDRIALEGERRDIKAFQCSQAHQIHLCCDKAGAFDEGRDGIEVGDGHCRPADPRFVDLIA